MAFASGIGFSSNRNPSLAAKEAVEGALKAAQIDKADFVFMSATIGYPQPEIAKAVWDEVGRVPMAGSSVEGVIFNGKGYEVNFAITVTVVKSDTVKFQAFCEKGLLEDSAGVGKRLADKIKPLLNEKSLGIVLLADGLTLNYDSLLTGWNDRMGSKFVPIIGGTAGDNFEFKKTHQYLNGEVFSDGAIMTLMSGEGNLAWAVTHGCTPIGKQLTVTKSKDNIIYEIDGKPALDVVGNYLGVENIGTEQWGKISVHFSLGFPSKINDKNSDYVIRFIPRIIEEEKALFISNRVENNSLMWMTRRDPEKISAGNDLLVRQLKEQIGDKKPKMIFIFDCAGRGKVIFNEEQRNQVLTDLRGHLFPESTWTGFYSFGEIAPVDKNNFYHNYTAVVAALY